MGYPKRPGMQTMPSEETEKWESSDTEITAAVGASTGGGYKEKNYWMATADVIGYVNGDKHFEGKTHVKWAVPDSDKKDMFGVFEKETVYRLKVRFPLERNGFTGDELISRFGMYVTGIISCGDRNEFLDGILEKFKEDVIIDSPVVGKLVLDKGLECFEGEADWCGHKLSILMDSEEEPEKTLAVLEELFRNCTDIDKKLRSFAASELTDSANDWLADSLEDGEEAEEITEEVFAERISPDSIAIHSDGSYEFYFYDDDMFWGHSVTVYAEADGTFTDANIEG